MTDRLLSDVVSHYEKSSNMYSYGASVSGTYVQKQHDYFTHSLQKMYGEPSHIDSFHIRKREEVCSDFNILGRSILSNFLLSRNTKNVKIIEVIEVLNDSGIEKVVKFILEKNRKTVSIEKFIESLLRRKIEKKPQPKNDRNKGKSKGKKRNTRGEELLHRYNFLN